MATLMEAEVPAPGWGDGDPLYEIIDGRRREKAVGYLEILLANRLCYFLNKLVMERGLGVSAVETFLELKEGDRHQLRPDLVYVSSERWSPSRPTPPGNAWPVVPEIVVGVPGPNSR